MTEPAIATVDTILRHTEDGVDIDGQFVPAITVLEAARHWKRFAKERGWQLRDSRGRAIELPDWL